MINRSENTVIVLKDCYPNTDDSEIAFIEKTVEQMGYVVKHMSVKQFVNAGKDFPAYYGDVAIIPNCDYLPLEMKNPLQNYIENHGSAIIIGGPLFYHDVRIENGKHRIFPLVNTLDANFASDKTYVREGITPSYKVFSAKNISKLKTTGNQYFFDGELSLPNASEVIIPCETNHGLGYDTDSNCRFISLVDCFENSAQDNPVDLGLRNGNRGSFAFIELENSKGVGYSGKVNYGMVENTQLGSVVASIGFREGIQKIQGAASLLKSMIASLKQGLFLYEAGANGIRFRENEDIKFGAKILNTKSCFRNIKVHFSVNFENGTKSFCFERLISPKTISEVEFSLSFDDLRNNGLLLDKDYSIEVSLIENDTTVDKISSVYSYESIVCETDSERFVKTVGNKFCFNNELWFMAGINYWPTYSPAKEKSDYWLGFCDKSNYDPTVIENDLNFMQKIGLNCISTRIDFSDFENCIHGLRDFLYRCKKHDIKVGIALTKATATKYYDKNAVEYIFSKVNIADNPTVAFIDVEWESACDPFRKGPNAEYDDEWNEWLIEKYGTIQNAEKELGVSFDQDIFGYPVIPEEENSKITAEICDFFEKQINRNWQSMYSHLKSLLPNQMITFRYGSPYSIGRAQAVKYNDFSALEMYDFNGFDRDFDNPDQDNCRNNCVGLCVASSMVQSFETGDKPIVWAEYGRSACGIKWHNELLYDHENRSYLEREVKYQIRFNDYMQQAVEESGCAGTFPWWWCGGFRYTELADFGYVMPNGTLTQSGKNYISFCEKMKQKIAEIDNRETYITSCNVYDYKAGKDDMLKQFGIEVYKEARDLNQKFMIKTQYIK